MSIKFFSLKDGKASKLVAADSIALERDLQNLFEANLEFLLGVRFLRGEYRVGRERIDTLGIDANGSPTIIEYKLSGDKNVINQAFGYLAPLEERQHDFGKLVLQKLGPDAFNKINWETARVICVAAEFNKSDLSIAKRLPALELVSYALLTDNFLQLKWLGGTSEPLRVTTPQRSSAQRKAKVDAYTDGMRKMDEATKTRYRALCQFILNLGSDIIEKRQQNYVAFARRNNIVYIKFRQAKILVYPNLYPQEIPSQEKFIRYVKGSSVKIPRVEFNLNSDDDLEIAKPLLRRAYKNSTPETATAMFRSIQKTLRTPGMQVDSPLRSSRTTHGKPATHYKALRKYISALGVDVRKEKTKNYLKFNRRQTIARMRERKQWVRLYLNLDPSSVATDDNFAKDMRHRPAHQKGAWRLQLTIRTAADIEKAKPLLRKAYEAS